jgi:hypothetical protein
VFHHDDSAVFIAKPSRAKRVVEDFLGGRPGLSGISCAGWAVEHV